MTTVLSRVVVSVSTSRSRDGFETYQRLVSVSSRKKLSTSRSRLGLRRQMSRSRLEILTSRLGLVLVSGGERLGLVSVSSFYVSCPSLVLSPLLTSFFSVAAVCWTLLGQFARWRQRGETVVEVDRRWNGAVTGRSRYTVGVTVRHLHQHRVTCNPATMINCTHVEYTLWAMKTRQSVFNQSINHNF